MTSDDDPLLDEWATAWRRDEPRAIAGLQRRMGRAALVNRLLMILELAVGAGGIAAGVWLAYVGNWLVGAAACLFGAFGFSVSLVTRAASPALDTLAVACALQAAVGQARRQYQAALGGLWVCAAALLFVTVVAADALNRPLDSPAALANLVRMQAVGTLFVAVALIVGTVTLLRAHRRLTRLSRLRDSL
jgi:hypothetical protein